MHTFFSSKKGLIVQTIYDVTGQSICWLLLSYNFGCMMYFPRKYPIKDIDNSGRNFKLWEKTNFISYVFAVVDLYMSVHYIYVIAAFEPIIWSSIKFFARSRTRAIKSSCLHLTIHFIVKQKKNVNWRYVIIIQHVLWNFKRLNDTIKRVLHQ